MDRSKPNFFWPLRLVAVCSLALPALLFVYSAWQLKKDINAQANERLERAVDVLNEHAHKAFQTVDRAISEINEVLRGRPDDWIRANESDLFLRFKRTQQALPQIESIWAFDKDGHPLVSSTILPVPRTLNNMDRSYFGAQMDADIGAYVSEVVRAKVGSLTFFVVSGRRAGEQPGIFNGVIGVTIMPEHFSEFYQKLARGSDSFALLRTDGTLLARYPVARLEAAGAPPQIVEAFRQNPEAGMTRTVSMVDGVARLIAYRKVSDFPVYVAAGLEEDALSRLFWTTIATNFLLGLPIVLAFFALSLYALRRAERFHEEMGRREAAEAALKQAQRLEAIGQLTGGVAHDFNNLLMVVDGNLQRIKRTVAEADLPRRAVESIEIAVRRGSELTRQLLSFSRRQTHEGRIIDLNERLPAVREMLQSSLRGDIVVDVKVPAGLWMTKIDSSEFELALLNLAVNARDAMNSGGRLTLGARNVSLATPNDVGLEGDFVAVEVSDTGAGIPPDVLGRVFEPFFTTKDVGKGTGLGLSQVYGFAQQAGGTATIRSVVGAGTVVTLYLPRCLEPAEPQLDGATSPVASPRLGDRGRVLLVEDNVGVAEVTEGFLEQLGYTVTVARDVASALPLMRQGGLNINIVVTDIVMPGGSNGLDLARFVREEHGGRIPVVLATGYSDHAQTASDEGFIILRKPFNVSDLREALVEALRRTAQTRDGSVARAG